MGTYHHRTTAIVLVAVLLVTACGTSQAKNTSLPPGKGGIPSITLENTAPANIDFALTITLSQTSPLGTKKLFITPQFMYRQSIISFQHGEKVECGGVVLPNTTKTAYSTTDIPPADTVVDCTYVSPQGQITFSYTVPAQSSIISPAPNTTITRSARTPMTVTILSFCKVDGILLASKNAQGGFSGGGTVGTNTCQEQQTADTTNMNPGPGYLGYGQGRLIPAVTNNPGFHSFALRVTVEAVIPVIWK